MVDEELSPEEEPEPKPPKEKIKIVEISSEAGESKDQICKACQKLKPVFVEMESDGATEYMCEECFRKDVADQGKTCKECEAPLRVDDLFCGKCGKPTQKKCSECGTIGKDDDLYCGKCGTKL